MRKEYKCEPPFAEGLALVGCGYEKCGAPSCEEFGSDGCYRLFGVLEGVGAYECAGKRDTAYKGDLILFRPGDGAVSAYPDPGGTWTVCWMTFKGTDAEYYTCGSDASEKAVKVKSDVQTFSQSVRRFTDAAESGSEAPSRAAAGSILLASLSLLKPKKSPRVRLRASEQAERALKFIEANYMRGITARDVTAELNIDRTHFFRIFKAKTGLSPEQYIMKLRIRKAKELLAASGCTVTETAALVGVNDVYYFSKLFKKAEGMSPTEYRKKMQSGTLQ